MKAARHSCDRDYSPVEAAYAVAKYFPADPRVWLEQCALAGIAVSVWQGRLCTYFENADGEQVTFLHSWLNLTPGGKAAVISLLDRSTGNTPVLP